MVVSKDVVTRRWRVAAALALCFALIPAGSALANHRAAFDGSLHSYGEMVEYDLVFPVAGDVTFSDTFYAARSGGDHHAQDLMAAKMTPIVAAAPGTIRYINWSRNPGDLNPERCCSMVITHDDGWETWYLHMNNDTPGTDDGQGWGIADGLLPGTHVSAGELIGWVGDSGNAESTPPHLHFELYDPEGVIVNPYQALLVAQDPDCDADCYPFVTLSYGSTGSAVTELQTMLSSIGHDPGSIDGVFGSQTRSAVQSFESGAGLGVDGVVDRPTWDTIVLASEGFSWDVLRLYGPDRFATAAEVALHTYPGGAEIVYVALGTNFPDAVAAGPAAAAEGAPVLLVHRDSVPGYTATAIAALDPSTIVIVGGTAAVSGVVASELGRLAPSASIVRRWGADRYGTAVEMTKAAFPGGAETVFIATGENFPDAMAAAPAAIAETGALLLVRSSEIPAGVAAELARLAPSKIVVVGGTSSVSSAVESAIGGYAPVERIGGTSRYEMSASVSETAFPDGAGTAYLAIGTRYPDALTGGAATAVEPGPVLLVLTDSIPGAVEAEIRRLSPSRVVVLGGPAAVDDGLVATLAAILAGAPSG